MNIKTVRKEILKLAFIIATILSAVQYVCIAEDSSWLANPPAFPEAKGGGSLSIGGRGGRVIYVTNLNADGPGSFRAACEAQGKRIIVFRVSGIIEIKKPIIIRNPYITIAGQTAPDGGILIKGHNLIIKTHDVILRFIRIRTGRRDDFAEQEGACLVLMGNCYNVIVDHCSFTWSNDENVTVWRTEGPIRNITFSWNLIAEGLTYKHASCGLLVGGEKDNAEIENILIYNNLFMSCKNRMPELKCKTAKVINNIIYNWQWWATGIQGGVQADIIANKYVRGPNTNKWPKADPQANYPIWLRTDWAGWAYGPKGNASIYIDKNIGPNHKDPNEDNWDMLLTAPRWVVSEQKPKKEIFQRNETLSMYVFCPVNPAEKLDEILLNDVGASRRLDENGNWQPNRDQVDLRLIEEYQNRTGQIPVDENEVGGFPRISENTGYKDSTGNGIPDAWILAHGFNPNDTLVGNQDTDNDVYTNIEEFLNGTNPRDSKSINKINE